MPHPWIYGSAQLHRIPTAGGRQRILSAAQDTGFLAFDTAPAYGNGVAERELGQALLGVRHERVVNTKFGIPVPDYGAWTRHAFPLRRLADRLAGDSARAYRRRDFSAEALRSSVEGSLERLRTDYVDGLFIHEPIAVMPRSECDALIDAAQRLREAGKIRAFGIAGPVASCAFCPSLRGIEVIQAPCAERLEARHLASGRTLILYGAYRAYAASGTTTDFASFLRDVAAGDARTQVIVASSSLATVRAFRGIFR